MKNQNGSTLVVSLVLLTIISLVAAYSLESSNIQSKMVANSLFTTLTYQECRNEQEAQLRLLNEPDSAMRDFMTQTDRLDPTLDPFVTPSITMARAESPPRSEEIVTTWRYVREDNTAFPGSTHGTFTGQVFETNCTARFRFSTNRQVQGVAIKALKSGTGPT